MDFYKKETNIFYIYFQIIKRYKSYMEQELSIFNLTPSEIDILSFLVNNEERDITAKDIGMYRGISKGLVSKSVNSLIDKNIIRTEINPNDGRSLFLKISNREDPIIKKVERVNDIFITKILDGINGDDMNIFLKINKNILSNIEELEGE